MYKKSRLIILSFDFLLFKMTKEKLIVAIIGQDCREWLNLAIESVEEHADAIVFIDGNPKNPSYESKGKVTVIPREFEHDHKGGIGRARNAYLDYVKKHHMGWYCLVLDADEVVDNIKILKDNIQLPEFNYGGCSVHMRHWIENLMKEDAQYTKKNHKEGEHFALNRLFKVKEDLFYPETEHAIIKSTEPTSHSNYRGITIWHLGYVKHLFEIKKKWKNHAEKSKIHKPNDLRQWYLQHVLGFYPTKPLVPSEFPKVVLKYFEIEDVAEEIYFKRRSEIENKHWIDSATWIEYCHPVSALFLGCGMGMRMGTTSKLGVQVYGYEKSKWAVQNTPHGRLKTRMYNRDITKMEPELAFDLVIAYDVLEHMEDEKALDQALSRAFKACKKDFICSIPFIGDPNLEMDKSHHIKQTREWWENKIKQHGFIIQPTPEKFIYKEQIIVCKRPKYVAPKTKTLTNVIMICAGDGSRWNNNLKTNKHFIEIEGEMILDRAIRLVNKYKTGKTNIYVVGNDDRYERKGTTWYKPKLNPKNFDTDKFLSSEELWNKKGRTVVLYGDVWFSEFAMQSIMEYQDKNWLTFGRAADSSRTGKKYGECFAQSFYPKDIEKHKESLKIVRDLYKAKKIGRCGGWEQYRCMIGVPECPMHVIYGQFFDIDDFTDDFDSKEDYDKWIDRRGRI